jgi:hypothetical protein
MQKLVFFLFGMNREGAECGSGFEAGLGFVAKNSEQRWTCTLDKQE